MLSSFPFYFESSEKSKMKRKGDLKRVVEVTRFSLITSHYRNEQLK